MNLRKDTEFRTIPEFKHFKHRLFKLHTTFVTRDDARNIMRDLHRQGYRVRIWERAGVMNYTTRYHVYIELGRIVDEKA